MTIGSPRVNTGLPVPEDETSPVEDEKDIPTQRPYRFSGYQTNQTPEGISQVYRHQYQPLCWSRRAAYAYRSKLWRP